MTKNDLSVSERVLLIVGGFLFVLMTTVIAIAVKASGPEHQLFNQYIRPFTLAAAGLGTGHYLGRSMRERSSIHINFAVGFFLGLFLESIMFTIGREMAVGNTGLLLPYPAVVIVTALFAFIMHLSPAIPNDDDFTWVMRVFAGPVTTGFLILSTIVEFILSLDPSKDTILFAGLAIIFVLFGLLWAYDQGKRSNQTDEKHESEGESDTVEASGG